MKSGRQGREDKGGGDVEGIVLGWGDAVRMASWLVRSRVRELQFHDTPHHAGLLIAAMPLAGR